MKDKTIKEIMGASLAVGFGVYALWLGYDNVVIAAVFAIIGYLVGRKTT